LQRDASPLAWPAQAWLGGTVAEGNGARVRWLIRPAPPRLQGSTPSRAQTRMFAGPRAGGWGRAGEACGRPERPGRET